MRNVQSQTGSKYFRSDNCFPLSPLSLSAENRSDNCFALFSYASSSRVKTLCSEDYFRSDNCFGLFPLQSLCFKEYLRSDKWLALFPSPVSLLRRHCAAVHIYAPSGQNLTMGHCPHLAAESQKRICDRDIFCNFYNILDFNNFICVLTPCRPLCSICCKI